MAQTSRLQRRLTKLRADLELALRHPRAAIHKLLQEKPATIQRRFFKKHSDGRYDTQWFSIYLHRKPHLLSAQVIQKGVWEPLTSKLFQRLLTPNTIVVDVGANIGWFTLLSADIGKKVYACEPDSENLELLRDSVKRYGNVEVVPMAITDYVGTATFYLATESAGQHSLVPKEGRETVKVKCSTLDALFPIETIDILKIDAEGSEPEVLEGAKNLIQEHRIRHVVMEWNPIVWKNRLDLLKPFRLLNVKGQEFDPNQNRPPETNVLLEPIQQ